MMLINYFLPDKLKNKIATTAVFGILFSLIMQLLSLYFLLQNNLNFALVFHLFSACLYPWFLRKIMPLHFRQDRVILVLLFLMCLLIPLISGFGLLISLCIGSYYAKPTIKEITNTLHAQEIPDSVLEAVQLSHYGGGSIMGILETSSVEEQRIKAVLQTRQMSDQEAIPILRVALLDPVDEVRLLAYSMLDKKEKNIDRLIHVETNKLDHESKEKLALVHLSLAEAYWELSYLGLVQGQAQVHILQSAYEHIQQALKNNSNDGETFFLQARIALALKLYEVAEMSLNLALAFNMSESRVAPYQAELAFATRRFDEIEQYISTVDDTAKDYELVSELLEQWG